LFLAFQPFGLALGATRRHGTLLLDMLLLDVLLLDMLLRGSRVWLLPQRLVVRRRLHGS
jgi:hypothetical protein